MDEFTDMVLSMSLEQIFDENLYKHKVKKIPSSFRSVDEYLGSYTFPLLEENRASLSSALQAVYKAPFAIVTSLTKSRGEINYNVDIDYWRNKISDRGKEPYKTAPGDFIILSNVKPETDTDLQRHGTTFVFASVKSIPNKELDDDDCDITNFILKVAHHIDFEDLMRKPLYVVFLTNITTNKRIWKGLKMRENLKIIESVLSSDKLDEGSCMHCSSKCNTSLGIESSSTMLTSLNESQNDAIIDSLHSFQCDHRPSVQLIWGPPGTGKTKTLSVLLFVLLRLGIRTLICAPTNVAVTELASRVVKLVREDSAVSEIDKDPLSLSLSEILVFGNKDRLKIGSDMEDVFLDNRARGLCMIIYWKQRIASMTAFLRDCLSDHLIYLERNMEESEPKSLLEFAREQFDHTALSLRKCMLSIVTHIPKGVVCDETVDCIMKLLSLLDSIEMLLLDEKLTCEELVNIFSQGGVAADGLVVDMTSFTQVRIHCQFILRSLSVSLRKVKFPSFTNERSVEEFCFQKASLLFCTASSAFKLHHMKVAPFELLLVDEAVQLKECELVIALQIPNVMHAILAGDEKQLPATIISEVSEEAGFGRSLFERLSILGHFKHLLSVQYRMHPSISWFPNSNFYQNRILDASSVQNLSYERCYLKGKIFGPYSFIDIVGGVEQLDDLGRSRRNMVEVAVVVKLVQKLFRAWTNGSGKNLSVGVISPYAAQVVAIKEKVKNYENHEGFEILVKSVDGFQGGEADIVIISTVRANTGGSIGFLSSPHRTNVALTRARHCLLILGNAKTLSSSDSVWKELVLDAKRRQCFFTVDDDSDIARARTDVRKELDQIDNMLNSDSLLFKNARWKVIFSDNFRRSFGKLTPKCVKKSVMNVLLKMAGGWRPKKINVDTTLNISSNVVKQFKVEDHHIICSIDVIKEDFVYHQVLKVWDIVPVGYNTKLFDRLDNIFAMYTDEFTKLCKEKCLEGNLEVPKSWSTDMDIIRYKNSTSANNDNGSVGAQSGNSMENSKVSESLLLMKFYSLSSCVANHLLSDNDGEEVDLPFEVTDEEREIIMFSNSSFILGRSGTGKTTVLTMKLYRTLQQHFVASGDSMEADGVFNINENTEQNLRQIFVSVSSKLCHAVKSHISHLKRFASGDFSTSNSSLEMDNFDEVVEFKDIPDSFVGIQPGKYPLIITFHKFTMMLDGTLGESFFNRFRDLRDSSHSVGVQTFIRKKEVTYDRFRSLYWPHFNAKMAKNFDSSRVYTEIMSHIKGGMLVSKACDLKLRREDYVTLSNSRVSTISTENRELIYDIFECYERMKMDRAEFDLADLVIDIHHRLMNESLVGDKMDFVYIDEVQDLTMRQIALFRHICDNVNEGFVFSGDTAQTIARGVDFRFEDIRSLFYNEFLMNSKQIKSGGRSEKGHMSDIFCLSQNFRTHTGVLRLAKSIIDLICHFFPHSIDVLTPETSHIYGDSPVLLEPDSDQNSIITIFGHSEKEKSSGNWVGFGAEQVILVRDDSARDELSKCIGHKAIILTIVDCKGLEFQDVLLYNFFGSSPVTNQWRLVYEFLNEKHLSENNCQEAFPSFSHAKHNILCSELKQLYVAITRTKQRLWICEKDEEVSKPIFDYWKRLSLVQVRKVDDSVAEAMRRSSTPEEWKSQGIKLFWEKNYEMAMMCFQKAGEDMWEKRAKAAGLRAAADRLRDSNQSEANIMLTEAAEIFDSIGRADSAAECFCDLGQYERAGVVYSGMRELRKAGECFTLAGSYERAAKVYSEGNYFTECLSACTKGKHFNMGLQYIDDWRQQGIQGISILGQDFLEDCARQFHQVNDKASSLNFVRAFYTMDSKRKFLRSFDWLEELLGLEEEYGNYIEAADIAKMIGDLPREANLLRKAGNYAEASSLIISYVLSNSLWISGSKGWPLNTFVHKEELLNEAILCAENVSGSFHALICAEAEILSHHQTILSELLRSDFASVKCESLMGKILYVMKLLNVHLQENIKKYEWDYDLLEDRLSQNKISVMSLFSTWNSHKEHVLQILKCLDSIEKQEVEECKDIAGFCFKYFGVRVLPSLTGITYRLLNPDAEWIKHVDERFMCRARNVVSLDAHNFALAARRYWRQELISVGLKVLETLNGLYKMKNLLNHSQSICLLCLFSTTNFFIDDSSSLDLKKTDFRRFQDFMKLSMNYYGTVFPLDPRQSLSVGMFTLRKSEQSKMLLEEIISENISLRDELSYGQIGRIMVIWFGSGKPRRDVYEKLLAKFVDNRMWRSFIEILGQDLDSPFNPSDLSLNLFAALIDTYNANWRMQDYISPHCFLYLVERLLIMIPHSRSFFYTTKSAYLEWLTFQQSDTNPSSSLVMENQMPTKHVFDFVSGFVHQFLQYSRDTAQWITKSKIECKKYHPLLILRLIMILCLLCLNSEIPFSRVLRLLAVPQISSFLPTEFREAIESVKKDKIPIVVGIGKAFRIIGDPVVNVGLQDNNGVCMYPDVIFLDIKMFPSRKEIMEILFPASTETHDQSDSLSASNTIESVVEFSSTYDHQDGKGSSPSYMTDALESAINNGNAIILGDFILGIKTEIEAHVNRLDSVIFDSTKDSDTSNNGEIDAILSEGRRMIGDCEKLLHMLDLSRDEKVQDLKCYISHVNNMILEKSQLDAAVSGLTIRNVGVFFEEEKTSMDETSDTKHGKTEVTATSCSNKVKGKKNKKKKGKKGRK